MRFGPAGELVIENAVLRHQLNVLRRRGKRPKLRVVDRLKLLIGARVLPSWRRAIAIVQPETVLRWHRAGFRLFWRQRSRPRKTSPLPPETIHLIRDMAARGRLWPACVVALVDRFAQHCHRVEILGESWRDKHRLDTDRPGPPPCRSRRKRT